LTEVVAGPNANTIYSLNMFDVVTGVTLNSTAAASTVTIGTGLTGCTHWFSVDYNKLISSTQIQVSMTAAANLSIGCSVFDVSQFQADSTSKVIKIATGITSTRQNTTSTPTANLNIIVESSDATGTFQAAFMQQGIA